MKVCFKDAGSLTYGYYVTDPVTVYDIRHNSFKELEFLIFDKKYRKWEYVPAKQFHPYEGGGGK